MRKRRIIALSFMPIAVGCGKFEHFETCNCIHRVLILPHATRPPGSRWVQKNKSGACGVGIHTERARREQPLRASSYLNPRILSDCLYVYREIKCIIVACARDTFEWCAGPQAYRKRLFSYFFHSVSLFLYFLLSNNSNPKVCNQRANFSRASLLIGLNQQPEEINNQDLSAICFKPG